MQIRLLCIQLLIALALIAAPAAAAETIANPPLSAALQRDWDTVTTRKAAATGRIDDYFQELLAVALRQAGQPLAAAALGAAEHLTRDENQPVDYIAALQILARFESLDETAAAPTPGEADTRRKPVDRLGPAGWYLLQRLRIRCYYRGARIVDAKLAATPLQHPGFSDAWRLIGPFGRHPDWAFDTPYPPEETALNADLLSYAGADFHWHPLPLSAASGGLDPSAACEPEQGVAYARSPNFRLLTGEPVETLHLLVWSTGPWRLRLVGGDPATAVWLARDPGAGVGADLQLYEVALRRDQTYRLLAKLPAGTDDFNVVFLDPRTRRPVQNLHPELDAPQGENPAVRELPLVNDLLLAVARPGSPGGLAPPERAGLTFGDNLRAGVTAYGLGAYSQARYYLRPVAHQSAAAQYWFALAHLDAGNRLQPGLPEEALALLSGAAKRDPGNREVQARWIEYDGQHGNRAAARARLKELCAETPLPPEIAWLRARLEFDWNPGTDIEPWLEQLPDNLPGPVLGPAPEITGGEAGHRSSFYLLKRRLAVQLYLRDRRYDAALDSLREIEHEYSLGHARHSLYHLSDKYWPAGLYCPPQIVRQFADLYLLAGQATTGYQELFGADHDAAGLIAGLESPALLECIWRLREHQRLLAPAAEAARDRADLAWQRLNRVHPDSPRLWRQLGDFRAALEPPGDSASAYAESFRRDNRQLDLLRYLPHFTERFTADTVPPMNLNAAGTDANPGLPALAGRTRRRAVYLSYLPQGDCLETMVEECRVTRTVADRTPLLPTDVTRRLDGRVRDVSAWLEFTNAPAQPENPPAATPPAGAPAPPAPATPGPPTLTRAPFLIGLTPDGADTVAAWPWPLPDAPGATRVTTVWQMVSRQMRPAYEPEFPPLVHLRGGDLPGQAEETLRVFAAVPANLTGRIGPLPLPAELGLSTDRLHHAERSSDYGPLGTGGKLHEWSLSPPPPPAFEPDAPPGDRLPVNFVLGRTPTAAEIARYHRLPERFRAGVSREIQEEADRIKRSTGVGGLRLLERLRQAVIEYVPVDRPELPVPASAVLTSGIGSRAALFLALARAMQLPNLTVAPAYLYPQAPAESADGPAADLPLEVLPDCLAEPTAATARLQRVMIAVYDGGAEPRILDLSDHAPSDGPGTWLPLASAAAAETVPPARRTRTRTPTLYYGGQAVLAAPPPGPAPMAAPQPAQVALPQLWTVPAGLTPAGAPGERVNADPPNDVFEIQLAVDANGRAEMTVHASWMGPVAQQILDRTLTPPRRAFDSEALWRMMLSDFPLSARLPGAVMRPPGWYLLNPLTQPQDLMLAKLTASEPAGLVGGPAYNTFTVEFNLDGTAYTAKQADGTLRCFLPFRRLQLGTRWAPLNERRQPLEFNEWRIAQESVLMRAAGRTVGGQAPPPQHFEFLPLITYDLEISPRSAQVWEASRTVRIQPGVVAPEDYPRFKQVLEQIAAADQTTVDFNAAP